MFLCIMNRKWKPRYNRIAYFQNCRLRTSKKRSVIEVINESDKLSDQVVKLTNLEDELANKEKQRGSNVKKRLRNFMMVLKQKSKNINS